MKTDEFFSLQGRKLLITNRVKTANRLKRIYNKESYDNVTSSLFIKRAVDVALELVNADRAMQGKGVLTFISSKSASVMFHQMIDPMIRDGKIDFIPKTSSGLQTSAEVYRVMNELCMGCRKEPLANDKAKVLMALADQFENSLLESEKCNEAMCLRFAVEVIENTTDIEYLLPWLSGCVLASLETDVFRYEEKVFINALAKKLGSSYEGLEFLKEESYESKFVKAYGLFNEVSHVADEIENGTTPYGSIAVYYMHEDYVNMLRMIFERRGIPVTFSSGIKCTTTNIIQFMLSVLDFYEHDFDYGMFMKIAYNPISKTKADDEDKRISFSRCYRYATSIGWGKERYAQYLDRQKEELASATDDESKKKIKMRLAYAEFMIDIVNISNEEKVGDMYSKLVEFTLETAYKNPEKKLVSNSLRDQIDFFNSFPDPMDLKERCNLIRDCLQSMKYSESEDTASVNAVLFSDFEVVERSKVFVLGLSAKYVSASSAESPVLSDKEIESCLDKDKGYVKLAKNSNKDRKEYMENTLKTISKGADISFSYVYFDTVELRDRSSSVFYIKLKGDNYEESVGYNVPSQGIKWDKDGFDKFLKDFAAKAEEKSPKKKEEETKTKSDDHSKPVEISPSALQELLGCPYKYYYDRVQGVKIPQVIERTGYQWLTPNEKGNLFHYTCEKYVAAMFPQKSSDEIRSFDETVFDECFKEAEQDVVANIPYPSEALHNTELSEIRQNAMAYFLDLHDKWVNEASEGKRWINIANEADFDDVKYTDKGTIEYPKEDGEPKIETYSFNLLFNGSIDRLDGYLNDGVLHLRIIDYKTGSREKKNKEIENNLQIQHYIYTYGAYKYLDDNWEAIIDRFSVSKDDIKEIKFDRIVYEFPFDLDGAKQEPIDATEVLENIEESDRYEMKDRKKIPDTVTLQPLPLLFDKKAEDTGINIRNILVRTFGLNQNGKFDEIEDHVKAYLKIRLNQIRHELAGEEGSKKNNDPQEELCKYCLYKPACRVHLH
ncbi:MAG: PD-(D/E)XK nuclease family protein [Clostridiales bacterium]|nr:PD-(D/E)XK nuclease family protein [Clostridiales bacterium]